MTLVAWPTDCSMALWSGSRLRGSCDCCDPITAGGAMASGFDVVFWSREVRVKAGVAKSSDEWEPGMPRSRLGGRG